MADKILHQVTFYETDEGFRVEVKGDKDKLREMGFGPSMMRRFSGFGPKMGRRGRGGRGRHHRHHGHGWRGRHGSRDSAEKMASI